VQQAAKLRSAGPRMQAGQQVSGSQQT
jgi:hypothetical protein